MLVQQGALALASELCDELACSVDFFEFGIGIWRDDCDAPGIDSTAVWSQDFWARHPVDSRCGVGLTGARLTARHIEFGDP